MLLDGTAHLGGFGRRAQTRHPAFADAAASTQRCGHLSPKPDFERVLHWRHGQLHGVVGMEATVVGERLACPQRAHDVQRFLEHRRTFVGDDRLGVEFVGLVQAKHEQQQQPPCGQPVECCQLFGKSHWVAAGHDQMGADLEPLSAACRQAQRSDRVEHRHRDDIGDPDRVVAQIIERIDEAKESGRIIGRSRARSDADPNLHRGTLATTKLISPKLTHSHDPTPTPSHPNGA